MTEWEQPKAQHYAVRHFCERGTILPGHAGRIARFLAENNGREE